MWFMGKYIIETQFVSLPWSEFGENCSHLLNLRPNICKFWSLNSHLISGDNDLDLY